jgi:hypothetical protein
MTENIPIWVAIIYGFVATIPLNLGVAMFNLWLADAYWQPNWPKKREWVFDREKYWYPALFIVIWVTVTLLLLGE